MLHNRFSWQLDAATLACAVVLAAFSIRVSVLSRKQRASSGESKLYQDKDGVATEESQKAYSVRWQNIALIVFTFLGISVALVEAVLVTLRYPAIVCDSWAAFIHWVTFPRLSIPFWLELNL
jgi:hypothetical protein